MMGVEYGEFWNLSPHTLKPFVKAYSLKRKERDSDAWVQGKYFLLAIGSSLSKDVKYPKTPFLYTSGKSQQDIIKEKFLRQMEIINARFKEG